MKLWKVSQTEADGYDTYDAIVVAAETEDGARSIYPDGRPQWPTDKYRLYNVWASSPANCAVQYIGEAAPGIEAGVILASFNAG